MRLYAFEESTGAAFAYVCYSATNADSHTVCYARCACLQQLEQAAITASLQSYAKDAWRKKRRRTDGNDSSINNSSSSSSSNSSKAALNLKLEKAGKAGGSSAPGGKEARHRYHSVPGGSSSSSSVDARSYPLAVQEMIMNGFPLEQVQAAFELVGDNLDDLLAVLMQQQP
jgi:hypothetical protein